ncbi:uncharacterized protein LOC110047480 [Orbicella faveolata]|uniref:uncharacterized protein LOC110047480 n=1 Tax=Orbicella faveolata TaxID=48498 RepID=UPI0009E45A0B|nr:uncharacterized protein LOC110047480 [Orbicella faveolata]
MNARFGEEPKRKRLKQSSIEESFKRHQSSPKSKVSPHLPDKKENCSQQKMQHGASPQDSFNVQEDEIKKKRALLADAAENRRGSASNTACTSATSTASSDMVVEGGSKDGLSDTEDGLVGFDDSPLLFPDSPLTAPPLEEVPSIQTADRFVSGVSFQ